MASSFSKEKSDMADLQQYEVEMRGEHTRLTQAYESQQTVADAEWEKLEAAKRALSAFRAKYGRVIKALDAGAVTVESGMSTAAPVAAGKKE
jgi:hypothetical protein